LKTLDKANIKQAISLAEAIDVRYLASTYEFLQQVVEEYDIDDQIERMSYSGVGEWFNMMKWAWRTEMDKDFYSWVYQGKAIYSGKFEKAVYKYMGIKDYEEVIVEDLILEKRNILIDFEGGLLREKSIDAVCTTTSIISMGARTPVEVSIENIDKIDISNALSYTDTSPDEDTRIQRGVLYLQIPFINNETFELDHRKPPIVEWTGTLHFVQENGQPLPLDQDVGVTLRLNFDSDYLRELGVKSW
jgi:hypothetical protein